MYHKHKPRQAVEECWKIQSYPGFLSYPALQYMLLNIALDKFLCKISKTLIAIYLQH